jgi:hypothetical protein
MILDNCVTHREQQSTSFIQGFFEKQILFKEIHEVQVVEEKLVDGQPSSNRNLINIDHDAVRKWAMSGGFSHANWR